MQKRKLNKAVVISPHRDDAVISIGDYVYENYNKVVVLNIFTESKGAITNEPENKISEIREKEDKKITNTWKFHFVNCHFPDTTLRSVKWNDYKAKVDLNLLRKIQNCIFDKLEKQKNIDSLFIPASYGLHPDHYLCSLAFSNGILFELLKTVNFFVYCDQQYYYEGKAFHEGHRYLERNSHFYSHRFDPKRKQKMISVYKSQLSSKRIKLLTSTIKHEYFWKTKQIFFVKSKNR